MGCLNMDIHAAHWEINLITVWRLQRAYLERQGMAQNWVKSKIDKITEKFDELQKDQEKRLKKLENER